MDTLTDLTDTIVDTLNQHDGSLHGVELLRILMSDEVGASRADAAGAICYAVNRGVCDLGLDNVVSLRG